MPLTTDPDRISEQSCPRDGSYSSMPGADVDHPGSAHYHLEAATTSSRSSFSYWASLPHHCSATLVGHRASGPSWRSYWRGRAICLSHQLQHHPPIWSFIYLLYISFMYFVFVSLLWNPIILISYMGITCIAFFPIVLTWIKVIQV